MSTAEIGGTTPLSGGEDSAAATLGGTQAGVAQLTLSGRWDLFGNVPHFDELMLKLDGAADLTRLRIEASRVDTWDSTLVSFLTDIMTRCEQRGIEIDRGDLPDGVGALLDLAFAVPERKGARRSETRRGFLEQLGNDTLALAESTGEILSFLGEVWLSARRVLARRARFRRVDLWQTMQQSGADALPIVSLVVFLVGVILAFIGQQQLERFGAKIYVSHLVGLAIVMQIGPLVTAIVLAGRTGAAFAAQLGTMQVNEEIDALKTLGISPVDFLVLPRMIALAMMTPLLAVYANLVGIMGGALIGTTVGGITLMEYLVETQKAIQLTHIAQGLINSAVYGAIVAVSGCLRGMQCGRSASAVGAATTSAVVTSIVFIVIAAAILTVIYDALGI